jgi:alkylhydroperoxidase family enzyme
MLGKKAGISDDQLAQMDHHAESQAFSELEKDVLRFAEEWTTKARVSAEVVQKLAQSLTPAQLVTLAATCAQANWTNRFNESLAIELP